MRGIIINKNGLRKGDAGYFCSQIGVSSTLLPYVTIGAGSLIGAGSVVTRDVPAGMLAYGNPARVARRVADLSPSDLSRWLGDGGAGAR